MEGSQGGGVRKDHRVEECGGTYYSEEVCTLTVHGVV